jgi:hypothetical protein
MNKLYPINICLSSEKIILNNESKDLQILESIIDGSIPYVENVNNLSFLLPKELLTKGNLIYNNKMTKEYKVLLNELLDYVKTYLTSNNMANYILSQSNNQFSKRVLYISYGKPDYFQISILHGLKTIFGYNCHDYPKVNYLYDNLLDERFYNKEYEKTLQKDLINKKYDLIIFSNFTKGMPYYGLINKFYKSNKIILLNSENINTFDKYLKKGHAIFNLT